MKKLIIFYLILLHSSSIFSMHWLSSPIGSLKEYAPNFYIDYWNGGEVADHEICEAAEQGNVNYLDSALAKRTDPNFLVRGQSPLALAVQHDKYDAIQKLLEHNADAQFANSNGASPLTIALEKPRLYAAGLLLAKKPNLRIGSSLVECVDRQGNFNEDQRKYVYEYIAKQCNLDNTIEHLFSINQLGSLKGFVLAHKKTAEKVFLKALEKNHGPTISVMLEKYATQLNQLQLAPENKKLLLEKYSGSLLSYVRSFNQVPEHLKDLEADCYRSLLGCYAALKKLHPKYSALKAKYDERKLKEALAPAVKETAQDPAELAQIITVFDPDAADQRQFFALLKSKDVKFSQKQELESRLADLHAKVANYTHYLDQTEQCCICMDGDYKGRAHVVVCSNEHSICMGCFNNPTVQTCPLCRQECKIDRLATCQSCLAKTDDLRLSYCQDCSSINITCKNCTRNACCKANICYREQDNQEFKKWGSEIIKVITAKHREALAQLEMAIYQDMIQMKERVEAQLKKIEQKLNTKKREYDSLEVKIKQIREEFNRVNGFSSMMFRAFALQADERVKVDQINNLVTAMKSLAHEDANLRQSFNVKASSKRLKIDTCKKQHADCVKKIHALLGPELVQELEVSHEDQVVNIMLQAMQALSIVLSQNNQSAQ